MRVALKPIMRTLALTPFFALACGGEPSPIMLGRVTSGLSPSEITIEVNGNERDITEGKDGRFSVQDLPAGEIELSIATDALIGQVTLKEVMPAELIEVEADVGTDHIDIEVQRREPLVLADPPERNGTLLMIGDDMIHHLGPGLYEGDVRIEGDNIAVIGPNTDCERGAVIAGDLYVEGNDVHLINISVLGERDLNGGNIQFYGGCTEKTW